MGNAVFRSLSALKPFDGFSKRLHRWLRHRPLPRANGRVSQSWQTPKNGISHWLRLYQLVVPPVEVTSKIEPFWTHAASLINRVCNEGAHVCSRETHPRAKGASPAIWDHAVLPATRHKWTRPALTPASKLVLDLPTSEGRKAELT